jgi:hypothetical protein
LSAYGGYCLAGQTTLNKGRGVVIVLALDDRLIGATVIAGLGLKGVDGFAARASNRLYLIVFLLRPEREPKQ